MTLQQARFWLIAFALLTAGLAMNLLAFQGAAPASLRKMRSEQGQAAASDKSRRLGMAVPEQAAGALGAAASATAKAAGLQDTEGVDTIRAIQRELQMRGYEAGTADGVPGLVTRAAIMAFEHDHNLALTGEASEATLKRILLGGSAGEPAAKVAVSAAGRASAEAVIRTVQQTLSGLGYNTGLVDGKPGEDTQRAIRDFEVDHNLPETGRVSGTLIARLAKAAGNGRLPGAR